MLQAEILAWFAKQTLAFWLRIVGVAIIAAILITPTCMYRNVKAELETAQATIQEYKDAAKTVDKKEKETVTKVEYKDKIVDRVITKTKIKREYVYVNNKEAADWACTFVPDVVIGVSESLSEADGPRPTKARALPEYCVLQTDSGKTPDK